MPKLAIEFGPQSARSPRCTQVLRHLLIPGVIFKGSDQSRSARELIPDAARAHELTFWLASVS